jgi:hypothetical protein
MLWAAAQPAWSQDLLDIEFLGDDPTGFFGQAVATSGDTVVVGDPNDDTNGANAGAIYVFVKTEAGWVDEAKLYASDPAPGDEFGDAVSISGDTIVVGVKRHRHPPHESLSGGIYIFERNGGLWSSALERFGSDVFNADSFGAAVALSGDTLAAGAPADDDGGLNAGAIYVFERDGGEWTESAKIRGGGTLRSNLGKEIALDADTLIVGGANPVYVFVDSGTGWTPQAELPGLAAEDFGNSVAVHADTVLVGARGADDPIVGADSNTGAAYVFVRTGTTWSEEAKLVAAGPLTLDNFGFDVSVYGDSALIGAPFGGPRFGRAYFFNRVGGVWMEPDQYLPPRLNLSPPGNEFGRAVAMSDRVLLFGAPRTEHPEGTNNQGAAYVAELDGDQDEDGLSDVQEAVFGTDPLDPDSDDDGLLDGTEVDMAGGSGCPDPLDSDSDNDGILDGEEVDLGTSSCSADTDGDGIPDSIDPLPTDPAGTEDAVAAEARAVAGYVPTTDLALGTAKNDNANAGRFGALSNRLQAAANEVNAGNIAEAIEILESVLVRVDGEEPPKDWIVSSEEADQIAADVTNLIAILEFLL